MLYKLKTSYNIDGKFTNWEKVSKSDNNMDTASKRQENWFIICLKIVTSRSLISTSIVYDL